MNSGKLTMPSPCDSNTYSSLDRVKNNAVAPQDDKHYSPLQHKTGTKQVRPHNGCDTGSEYGKLADSSQYFNLEKCTRRGGYNEKYNDNCNQPTVWKEYNW